MSFRYRRERSVLEAVEFSAGSGEVVGILGRNGSGKTTLLRLVAGLLRPTAGRIVGIDAPAVVFDRTPFLEPLTARENLLGTLSLRGRGPEEAPRAADEFLRRYDLLGDADRPVEEFSLGMRRRLALAECFAANQRLVLLDEPTLGLDPSGRAGLAAMLGERSRDGLAVLLATNDAAFARLVCDRVLLLHDRGIVARGTPTGLIAALEAPSLLDIRTIGTLPGTPPPAGLRLVNTSAGGLTLSAPRASQCLPDAWAWLEAAGCHVHEVRIREPDLADVFRMHTGEELPAPGEVG